MANGQDVAGVGASPKDKRLATAQEVGAVLSGMMVACRARPFPRAANGGAVPCSDERAAHVRGEMQREGGSPHWEGIMALAFCDLADAKGDEVVTARTRAVFVRALAEIDARIPAMRIDRPFRSVNVREQKYQSPVDIAQMNADENDAESLATLIAEIDRYRPQLDQLRAVAQHRLTILSPATPARQFVGRRRQLALHS